VTIIQGELWTLLVNAIPVALLGAVLGLDMVSFPQVMISRPLVSATLAGALLGRPSAGLLIGVVLELIALETLPFGASRYAEWGSAGAVGGAVFAAQPPSTPAGLPMGVLAALAAALLSSRSMVVLRRWNGRYATSMRDAINAGSASAVTSVQLRGLLTDFIRGGTVTLISLLAFLPLTHRLLTYWNSDAIHSRAFVVALAGMVAAGAVWRLFHTTVRGGWLFLLGLGVGAVVLLVVP
jgi:mannose/fructose/N-acetylgalactosamine-specific phosphotransferase system component IIC